MVMPLLRIDFQRVRDSEENPVPGCWCLSILYPMEAFVNPMRSTGKAGVARLWDFLQKNSRPDSLEKKRKMQKDRPAGPV